MLHYVFHEILIVTPTSTEAAWIAVMFSLSLQIFRLLWVKQNLRAREGVGHRNVLLQSFLFHKSTLSAQCLAVSAQHFVFISLRPFCTHLPGFNPSQELNITQALLTAPPGKIRETTTRER